MGYVAARFKYLVALGSVHHKLDPLLLRQLFLKRWPSLHIPVLSCLLNLLIDLAVTTRSIVRCVHQRACLPFPDVVGVASPRTRLLLIVVKRLKRAKIVPFRLAIFDPLIGASPVGGHFSGALQVGGEMCVDFYDGVVVGAELAVRPL